MKAVSPVLGPALLVIALAGVLRVSLAARQDLWADELFSLAIATGHSLEHPASAAVPALGDFVEPSRAVSPASFRSYLEHESPPAGPGRIIRAVLLSDTSPPLYYLGLALWTRAFGTSDFAVHALSVIWALTTMPFLWLLGYRLGGPREALTACVLFAVAPLSLYYSVETRMYSMLWFLATVSIWLTLRLHERDGAGPLTSWILISGAGLLTHYFYAFVWMACVLWLLLRPGRCSPLQLAIAFLAALILVAPWYQQVPHSLAQWRVTGHWLDGRPSLVSLVSAPFALAWSFLSSRGVWGGLKGIDILSAIVVLGLGIALLRRGWAAISAGGRDLIWLWAVASCTGPVAFDLLRNSSTSMISRYALVGMPAAMLLVGFAAGTVPVRISIGALTLLVSIWLTGLRDVFRHRARAGEPYRAVAVQVGNWAQPGDLVIVHSIPSGVLGISRYLRADVPVAAWIGQLGLRRTPDDVRALVAARKRVALIRIHEVAEPAPEETWLRANATVLREEQRGVALVVYFALPATRR